MANNKRISIVQQFCPTCGKITTQTKTDHTKADGGVYLTMMVCTVCHNTTA